MTDDRDPWEQLAREETEKYLWEHMTPQERAEYEEYSKNLDKAFDRIFNQPIKPKEALNG